MHGWFDGLGVTTASNSATPMKWLVFLSVVSVASAGVRKLLDISNEVFGWADGHTFFSAVWLVCSSWVYHASNSAIIRWLAWRPDVVQCVKCYYWRRWEATLGLMRSILSVALAHFPDELSSSSDTAWRAMTVEFASSSPSVNDVDWLWPGETMAAFIAVDRALVLSCFWRA